MAATWRNRPNRIRRRGRNRLTILKDQIPAHFLDQTEISALLTLGWEGPPHTREQSQSSDSDEVDQNTPLHTAEAPCAGAR